jgi:hypothetical protein
MMVFSLCSSKSGYSTLWCFVLAVFVNPGNSLSPLCLLPTAAVADILLAEMASVPF